MVLKPVFPSHLYEKDFSIFSSFHNNHLVRVYASRTKPMDPLAGSEIPVEWEAIDQDDSVSDDRNVTYWMDSFKNKWLNEAVYTAWSSNPSLVAMAEQTLARGEEALSQSLDYTTGKSRSEWIEE